MISKKRIIILSIIMLIMLPNMAMAVELITIYGVKVHMKDNKILDGYILTYSGLLACNDNKDHCDKWNSFLERMRKPRIRAVQKDQLPPSGLQKNDPAESQLRTTSDRTVQFIDKLVKIESENTPNFLCAKSSVKEIKINDIKSIEGVRREWSGTEVSAFYGVPKTTDFMAEYISNHTMIASYTFNAEDSTLSAEEYAYGQHTTYLSYNPEYPRERLIKQRKIIDKMSDDILDKNKLIRFTWADD